MEEGRWGEVIPLLREQASENPDDSSLQRDLGRALLESGRYEDALAHLIRAGELDPEDRSVPLLLGLCYEGLEEWEDAIGSYHSYPRSAGSSAIARAVRGRIARLVGEVYAERARTILQHPEPPSESAVVVRYFHVLTETEAYGFLGKGLAEQLILDLAKAPNLHATPRLLYEALQDEVERSRSRGLDPLAVSSLDDMLGAGWSVGGTILPRRESGEIRIEYFLVNNMTGEVSEPISLTGSFSDFFEMEKRIVYEVLERLDVPLSERERQEIGKIPTINFPAFLVYCGALDAEDREEHERARALFAEAARLDPHFILAEERAERTVGSRAKIRSIALAEIALPGEKLKRRRLASTADLLAPAPLTGEYQANDVSNVRPLGSATVILRIDRP
jgi:tetratricopeptide (TPR) repeat protein